jgi:serine/threonine-protein kinase
MVQTILQQVGSALGYAHRRGIIHRDIKPANIMVDTDGWAVVTDFGIAKVTEAKGLTMTGATVGTPSYMSPEQCAAKELTGASDQYSLGIVAYEMLAGRLPFVAESVMAIMYAHFNEPPPPIGEVRQDTPPELAGALMQMLEKEPENRFPDIDAATAAIGGAPLSHDDPIRTHLMTLAATGRNLQKMKRLSTPVSPTPAARTPGKATAAATKRGTAHGTRGVPFAVRPPRVTVAVGGAVQLSAHRKSADGRTLPGTEVSWASTEPDVASVSEEGLVTALAPGTAVITCAAEAASATATITVTPEVRRSGGGLVWKLVGAAAVAGIGVAVYLFGPWSGRHAVNPASDSVRSAAPAPVDSLAARGAGTPTTTVPAPPPTGDRPADRGNARQAGGRPVDTRGARREAALAQAYNDSLVRELRQSAGASRARAVAAGATGADLAAGDAERQAAEGLATQGKIADAVARMSSAIGLWTGAEQTARARLAATPPVATPARGETPAPAAPAAPADPRPQIDAAIQAYARAIESRDVSAVRRAYPGLTTQQMQTWKDFFTAVRNLKVELRASRIIPNGDTAEANVQGSFSFLQDRRPQVQPVQFRASLERGDGGWRITAIQ